MSRRSTLATAFALGGLAGLGWARRAGLASLAVRAMSQRLAGAARRHGVAVDLGPARGKWVRLPLAADLGRTLSEVVGTPLEAVAYSRFGGFSGARSYSAYLDPTSPYYQAWLGAYVVFDSPTRPAFGFDSSGDVQVGAILDTLEADQRLVYRSLGCPNRFPDGRCTRTVGTVSTEPLEVDGERWWRATGEADTWSTFSHGSRPEIRRLARWLYGVVPPDVAPGVEDYHPIRVAGEFWLRHDPALGATCAAFLVAPFRPEPSRKLAPSEPLLLAARSLLRQVSFSATRTGRVTTDGHG